MFQRVFYISATATAIVAVILLLAVFSPGLSLTGVGIFVPF